MRTAVAAYFPFFAPASCGVFAFFWSVVGIVPSPIAHSGIRKILNAFVSYRYLIKKPAFL
jgi:hypothetical protein